MVLSKIIYPYTYSVKSRATRQNITKFVLATIVFYAMLSFNVFRVGELLVPSSKDYLQVDPQLIGTTNDSGAIYIQEAIQEIQSSSQWHGAASASTGEYQSKRQGICNSNTSLCKDISFVGTYTDYEKFLYLWAIFKVANFIHSYLITHQSLDDTLQEIKISKDNGTRRGYATWTDVVLNLWSVATRQEFLELISHELGHILDLGMLNGTDNTKDTLYTEFSKAVFALDDLSLSFYKLSRESERIRKANSSKDDFCSGYGMSDPFEDFAECRNLYLHHNTFFKLIAKANSTLRQKYNTIASRYEGNYISKTNIYDITNYKKDSKYRPWDTTRIY